MNSDDKPIAKGDGGDFDTSKGERENERRKRAERRNLAEQFQPLTDQDWYDQEPPPLVPLVRYGPDSNHEYAGKAWLPRGKFGMLVAPGGTGKTQALIQLAMCVASPDLSRKWLGLFDIPDRSRGPVVLALGEESTRALHRRIANVLESWELEKGDNEAQCIAENLYPLAMAEKTTGLMAEPVPMWSLEDSVDRKVELKRKQNEKPDPEAIRTRLLEGWSEQYDQWRELLRQPPAPDDGGRDPRPWKAIILDPASQFIGPDVEKDNAAATRFVRMLQYWASKRWTADQDVGPTVLCAHHASQSAAGEDSDTFLDDKHAARGSTGLTGGVRWQANMVADQGHRPDGVPVDVVRMRVNKENDGVEGDTVGMVRDTNTGVLEFKPGDKIDELLARASNDDENDTYLESKSQYDSADPGIV